MELKPSSSSSPCTRNPPMPICMCDDGPSAASLAENGDGFATSTRCRRNVCDKAGYPHGAPVAAGSRRICRRINGVFIGIGTEKHQHRRSRCPLQVSDGRYISHLQGSIPPSKESQATWGATCSSCFVPRAPTSTASKAERPIDPSTRNTPKEEIQDRRRCGSAEAGDADWTRAWLWIQTPLKRISWLGIASACCDSSESLGGVKGAGYRVKCPGSFIDGSFCDSFSQCS